MVVSTVLLQRWWIDIIGIEILDIQTSFSKNGIFWQIFPRGEAEQMENSNASWFRRGMRFKKVSKNRINHEYFLAGLKSHTIFYSKLHEDDTLLQKLFYLL